MDTLLSLKTSVKRGYDTALLDKSSKETAVHSGNPSNSAFKHSN